MLMTGMFHRSLDDKLRFGVPKQFRSAMPAAEDLALYIAPGTDGSLEMYTEEGFDRIARQMEDGPRHSRSGRAYHRVFYSQVQRVELDRQGRVRLPVELAQLASINKEIVLVGVRDHIEIWDRERWERYLGDMQPHFDELAEQMSPDPSPPPFASDHRQQELGESVDLKYQPTRPR
jgi:MraZ protein